ncbi:MAG TPA: hypothetical protein GXZ52_00850 [Clostridiales bacterium]|nr:hypothetical protein [Clostridiales bacterium]
MKYRVISMLLCTVMLIAGLAGCAGSEIRSFTNPENEEETSAETGGFPSDSPGESRDYSAAYAAYDPDELVMTINDLSVRWEEYFYWIRTVLDEYEYQYGRIADWDAKAAYYTCGCEIPGECGECESNRDYITNGVLEILVDFRALESNARRLGAELTEEDYANLEAMWEKDVEAYSGGDEEAFVQYMESIYLTRELYDYINQVSCLYYETFDKIYGPEGELCSDEDALSFAESKGFMMAKHILLSKTNPEGEELSEEEQAEKLATAKELLAQLRSCESAGEMTALFDKLMSEHSEDVGLSYYPDGYCFSPGKMVAAFEDAAAALKEYEISEIVETDFGYHIILRLPLDPNAILEYYSENQQYDLRYVAAIAMYDSLFNSWKDEAQVEPGKNFVNFDISVIL